MSDEDDIKMIKIKLEPSDDPISDDPITEKTRLKRLRTLKGLLQEACAFESLKQNFQEKLVPENGVKQESPPLLPPPPPIEEERPIEGEAVVYRRRIHRKPSERKPRNSTAGTECICETCGLMFNSKKNMLKHMEGYHTIPGTVVSRGGKTIFRCKFCELEFWARSELFRHCHQKHNDSYEERKKRKRIKRNERKKRRVTVPPTPENFCTHCNVQEDSLESFVAHLEKVHPDTYCDICYKNFLDPTFLLLHRRVHFGGNPFACDLCPRVLKTLHHVAEHRRSHTGDRPYKCAHCPTGFAAMGDLNKHMKNCHTKDPSYLCKQCPAKFHSSSQFHRHKNEHKREAGIEIHDGRPKYFACKLCDETFANGNDRKEHVLVSHAEGRPFECGDCGKRFKLGTHLKAHLLTHTGVKTHTCDYCPAAYYLPGDLRRHIKRHRKDKEC